MVYRTCVLEPYFMQNTCKYSWDHMAYITNNNNQKNPLVLDSYKKKERKERKCLVENEIMLVFGWSE